MGFQHRPPRFQAFEFHRESPFQKTVDDRLFVMHFDLKSARNAQHHSVLLYLEPSQLTKFSSRVGGVAGFGDANLCVIPKPANLFQPQVRFPLPDSQNANRLMDQGFDV